MENKKREEKKALTLNEAVIKVNEIMVTRPALLNISLTQKGGAHTYEWAENDNEAKKKRDEIREVLKEAWQNGALNYQMIADKLRVDVLSIQALIDEDFLFNYPHLK
jgi:ArsR family metal-binding transcriptional regulator